MVHLNEFTAPLGRASESDERCRDKCAHRGVLVLTMPSYINSVMMCGADAAAVTEMCIYVLRFSTLTHQHMLERTLEPEIS